ncbi:MAG: LysR family transcriptional regulator [Alteromonadaceae bacterium]|nr:LysR family transcriptional regulator [Alteromonadaceae bacterium]
MDLNIDCLRTFVAVSELSSFTKAAVRRHRVQSAISWQIKKLEQQLDTPLFVRHNSGVSLTRAGKLLFKRAREIIEINELALNELSGVSAEQKVTIGTSDVFLASFIPELLRTCRDSHPDITIDVVSGYSDEIWRAYSTGEVDIALTQNCPESISSRLLLSTPMVWIAPTRQFSLKNRKLRIACFTEGCSDRAMICNALGSKGLDYEVVFSSSSLAGVLSAVENDLAISAIPHIALNDNVHWLENNDLLPNLGNADISISANYTSPDSAVRIVEEMIVNFFESRSNIRNSVTETIS